MRFYSRAQSTLRKYILLNGHDLFRRAQASLVAQLIKRLPEMQGTWVQSLGWEGPLEKGMATYSSIFVWRIP